MRAGSSETRLHFICNDKSACCMYTLDDAQDVPGRQSV